MSPHQKQHVESVAWLVVLFGGSLAIYAWAVVTIWRAL